MPEDARTPPSQGLERKLATIVSADVAEYSRLMAEDEEGSLRIFRSHKEVFEQLVSLHRGRVFNTAGDAILAEFTSAVEAVRCATEIQAALHTRNDHLPSSRQVRFRIGINLGDVMVQGDDLLGDGVNVAARLQGAAEPGGICISGSVYDQIRNKLSLTFKSLGEQSFKNISQPVRTFTIAGSDTHGAFPSPSTRRGDRARSAKTLAAALLLLVVMGGAYWGYTASQRRKAEQAGVLAQAEATRQEGARREAQLQQERQVADEARRRAETELQAALVAHRDAQIAAERARAEQALRVAEADKKRAEDEARHATEELRKKEEETRKLAASRPAGTGEVDGLYAGMVCYGPAATEQGWCYRGQATITDSKITGRWPGRDPAVTVILSGLVSASGNVQIEIHTESAAQRRRIITMIGSLHNGKLDATGSFMNGRAVSLNWQRQ
jgi:class 3 adenylate cyclase